MWCEVRQLRHHFGTIFSHNSLLYSLPPHAPCAMLYWAPMLIGCGLMLVTRFYVRFTSLYRPTRRSNGCTCREVVHAAVSAAHHLLLQAPPPPPQPPPTTTTTTYTTTTTTYTTNTITIHTRTTVATTAIATNNTLMIGLTLQRHATLLDRPLTLTPASTHVNPSNV